MPISNAAPSLSTLLRRTIKEAIKGLYTFMPGKVIEYDHTKQEAVIQPALKIELPDDPVTGQRRAAELPLIPNVPVRWPRVGGESGTIKAYMYMPMRPGSLVGLFFSMRSIDKWLSSNGQTVIDPNDTRTMDIADAFAVPGFYPTDDPIPNVDDDDVRIILDHPDGGFSQFYLGGNTGDIVGIPANKMMLGSANPTKGAARETDPTISTGAEDTTFWNWLAGLVNVFLIPPGGAWTVVGGDGGAALQTAMTAYLLANPVPTQLIGKISAASTKVFAED